jgi:DNA-binding NarL/FixJ family response regulator
LSSESSAIVPVRVVRVLMVDDFEPWRREIRKLLRGRPEFHVIAEATGGLEAVQMAHDLKPDLILLDINLPDLNGIHAARRIRHTASDVRIVFMTQDNDHDIVREALGTGAHGYVLKIDSENELLTAMDGALRGEHFISSGLKETNLRDGVAL